MDIAHGVQQPGHLLLAGADHLGIRVTGGGHAKRGGQIQILFAGGIPNLNAPSALPDDWPPALWIHKSNVARFIIAQQLECCFGIRHRNLRFMIYDLPFAMRQS